MKYLKFKIMKAKNIILLMVTFSLMSCSGFLDEKYKSGLSTDTYASTADGIKSLVNACYSGSRVWFGQEAGFELSETGTDIFLRGGDNKANQISDYTIDLNGSQSDIGTVWTKLYTALNTCNTTISELPSANLSDADNTSYEGQAKFLRSLYLWLIVENWGNVVLYTTPVSGVVTEAHRSSVDDFYKVIMSDLDTAIKDLPSGKSTDGTITQDVAMAFKARMCLTRASETNDASLYVKADSLAEAVINSGHYKLYDKYNSVWDVSNDDGGNNSEVIYYVNYTSTDVYNGDFSVESNVGNAGIVDFVMKYDKQAGMTRDVLNARPFQRFMPSLHLLNLFDPTIDQRYAGTFKDTWIANISGLKAGGAKSYPLMAYGDTAIYIIKTTATAAQKQLAKNRYLLMDKNSVYLNDGGAVLNRSQYIEMHKFADPTAAYNSSWSSRDAFVIRLPEMYLIAAEALMKTDPNKAVNLINTLRMKRAITGEENQMKIDASQLNIDFVLEERAREFCGEQLRWFDLKRTGKLVDYVKKYNPDAAGNIQDYHNIRPIPLNELDAITNKSEFQQNPGYTK
jgi:starch-binding outer membrane protein, SusD/RagB family